MLRVNNKPEEMMIDYMLMNLGLVAAAIGIKPEHVDASMPVPDDTIPPRSNPPTERPRGIGRGIEAITIAESFYSPIRRTDFL